MNILAVLPCTGEQIIKLETAAGIIVCEVRLTISLLSFIGGGKGLGSLPRMYPKSTWMRCPCSERRRLSRCLSPTPRR